MSENCCCKDPKKIHETTSELSLRDHVGSLKVRFGIGRMNYKVDPGLYSLGSPNGSSPVLVSANYKLTFDTLRKELSGMNCYLLILDTKGVNVWCAAGKGTFGTGELVNRIKITGIADVISHRTLILPQLGAPGICAHEVKKQTGFDVVYGPVSASDIKEFISADMIATRDMRTVKFTLKDRMVLTPVEFVNAMKISLIIFGVVFLFNLIAGKQFGVNDVVAYMGAVVAGTVLTPILLPVIPVRAFSLKGWIIGLIWAVFVIWFFEWYQSDLMTTVGYVLILPSVSAFFAMNFTGSSTYTSFSGVIKEMKVAVPFIALTITVGILLLVIGKVF